MRIFDGNPRAAMRKRAKEAAMKSKAADVQKFIADYERHLQEVKAEENNDRIKEDLVEQEQTQIERDSVQQHDQSDIQQPEIKQPEIIQQDTVKDVPGRTNQVKNTRFQFDWETPEKFDWNKIFETTDSLQNNVSTKQPEYLKSKKERDEYFKQQAEKNASEIYDTQIQQLTNQKQRLIEDFNKNVVNKGMLTTPTYGGSTPSAQTMIFQDKLTAIDQKIGELRRQRGRYISQMQLMTDSRQLFSSQLAHVMSTSDTFLDQMTKTREAQEKARSLRQQQMTLDEKIANALKISTPVYGNYEYQKSVAQMKEQMIKEEELNKQADSLQRYIDHLGRLPKYDELPKQYQQAAVAFFTKDGKFLLDDPEFRKEFAKNNIVLKDEFSKLSNVAKNLSAHSNIDRNNIESIKERFQMLEDLEYINNPKSNERSKYRAAHRILDQAMDYERISKELKENSNKFGTFARNVGVGHMEFFKDPNSWLFDVVNIDNASSISKSTNKLLNNQQLTDADKSILQASVIKDMYRGMYGDYERENNGYAWGKISAESLKFMLEFIATRGLSSQLQKGANRFARQATKKAVEKLETSSAYYTALYASEEYGKDVALKKALDWAAKTAIPNINKAGLRLTADAAYAATLTNTLGLPKTILDAYQNSTPKINARIDAFGNPVITGADKTKDFSQALWDSERRNWIENFSEMMGEWNIGRGLKWAGKKVPKLGQFIRGIEAEFVHGLRKDIQDVARTYVKRGIIEQNKLLSKNALFRAIPAVYNVFNKKMFKAGQFHGFFGEISEEYYGLILQHMMGVQDDPNKNLWDDIRDQSKDIWGGIAVSTGILGAIGLASSVRSHIKFNNAIQNLHNAFGDKAALEIRRAMAFAPGFDIMNVMTKFQKFYGSGEVRGAYETFSDFVNGRGVDKKTALAEYTNALLNLRGAVYGEDVVAGVMGYENRELVNRARELGYTTANYQSLRMMSPVIRALRSEGPINQKFRESDDKTVLQIYEENNGSILKTIDEINNSVPVEKQADLVSAIVAYHNALQYKEGIDARFDDLVDSRVSQMIKQIQLMTNRNSGEIEGLTRVVESDGKDGDQKSKPKKEKLYLVDGALHTKPASDEVSAVPNEYGANDNGYVLVSNVGGNLRYVSRKELADNGWTIDTQPIDPMDAINDQTDMIFNQAQENIDAVYEELGATPIAGQRVQIGEKVLTILDATPMNGVTYSISDEDGNDAKIFRADTYEEVKQVVQKEEEDAANDITKWFKDSAKALIKSMRNRQAKRAVLEEKAAKEAYYNKVWDENSDDWEDEDDVKYTPDSPEGKRRAEKAMFDLWESRDFDDIMPEREIEEPEEEDDEQIGSGGPVIETEPEPGGQPEPGEEGTGGASGPIVVGGSSGHSNEGTPPSGTGRPKGSENDPQEDALKQLLADINAAEEAKQAEATGFHYFINYDGRERLFRRVHSVKPDAYDVLDERKETKALAEEYKQRILNIVREIPEDGKVGDAIKAEALKILDEIEASRTREINEFYEKNEARRKNHLFWLQKDMDEKRFSLNINKYADYANKYSREYEEVVEAVSTILAAKPINPSVIIGNIYDVIARYTFENDIPLAFDDDRLSIYYYGKKIHIGEILTYYTDEGEQHSPLITEESYNMIVKKLLDIKNYYEDVLGWKLVTRAYTLHAKLLYNGSPQYVAGETDCIAIDRQGRRHIIDFKTVSKGKGFYGAMASQYFKEQTIGPETDQKKTYSLAMEYAMQLYMYKILQTAMGGNIQSSETLLFSVKHIPGITNIGRFIRMTEQSVKDSVLTEKKDGKNVPNRVVLDDFDGGEYHEIYEQLKRSVTLYTTDELSKLKSNLASLQLETPSEFVGNAKYSHIVSQINGINEQIKNTLSELEKHEPSNTEERLEQINKIKQLIQTVNDTKQQIDQQLADYKYKEQRRAISIDFFNQYYQQQTKSDIRNTVFVEYDQYVESLGDIEDFDIDELSDEQIQDYIVALARIQIVINNALELGAITNKQLEDKNTHQTIQDHINHQRNVFLQKIDDMRGTSAVMYFDGLVASNSFPVEESDEEVIEEKRSSTEVTGLNDRSKYKGAKSVTYSKSKKGTKLSDVIENADFINSAEFYVQRDKEWSEGKPRFEMVIIYNGEEFSPVTLNVGHTVEEIEGKQKVKLTEKGSALYTLLCNKTETSDGSIVRVKIKNSKISRTFGEFKKSKGRRHVVEQDLIDAVGQGFSEIAFEKGGRFGLIKSQKVGNAVYNVVVTPGDSLNGKKTIAYVYSGKNKQSKPQRGGVVMLYTPGYEEFVDRSLKASQRYVPVNLYNSHFTAESAQLILDILTGNTSNLEDSPTTLDILNSDFTVNGKTYIGLKNIDVLQMFISWGNHNRKGQKQHIHLAERDGKIHIIGLISNIGNIDENGVLTMSDIEFDLNDVEDSKKFVEFLQNNINMQVFYDNMAQRMRDTKIGVAARFIFDNTDEEEIVLVNSTKKENRISIKLADVAGDGISGMSWYLKNGFLLTDFEGLERPLISIDEDGAIDENVASEEPKQSQIDASNQAAEDNVITDSGEQMSSGFDVFMSKHDSTDGSYRNRGNLGSTQGPVDTIFDLIDEQEARDRIRAIVGDVPVEFEDEVLATVRNGRVVGQCYKDFIKLSHKARRGTEYHEAFHRVLELLIDEKLRNKAYKQYRKKFGKNLTDQEIAERAADEFWWYKENKPIKKWSWNFKELLQIIKNWYDFFTKVGSFTLWRLYSNASKGAYAKNRPTKEALARWKSLTKENGGFLASTFEFNGMKFEFIANHKEYDSVINTVKYIAMSPNTYDKAGIKALSSSTIGDVELTPELIMSSPTCFGILTDRRISKISKMKLVEALGYSFNKQGELVKVNNNGKKLLRYVTKDLKKYESNGLTADSIQKKQKARGITAAQLTEDQLTGDQDGRGVSEDDLTQQRQFGEFQITSDQIDPRTRVTPRVKMFFAIAEDVEMQISFDRNGQPSFKMVSKLNDAGLPQAMDFNKAWGLILNKVYYCRSQKSLYERLAQLKNEDPFFQNIYDAYVYYLKAAYGDEHGNFLDKDGNFLPIKDNDKFGVVAELASAICHSKNIPIVLQSIQNSTTEEHGMKVMSASMEYTVRETRRNWSAAIASGEGEYLGLQNGKYFIKPGHSLEDFKILADWFRRFVDLFTTSAEFNSAKLAPLDIQFSTTENGETKSTVIIGENIKTSDAYLYKVCQEFVNKLNSIGIGFSMEDFMFLLNNRYGHYDIKENTFLKRLQRFADDLGAPIKGEFCQSIQSMANISVLNYKQFIQNVWSNLGHGKTWLVFIDEISKARYYRLCNEQMTSFLTIGGKKQYAMSEHNFITDMADQMKDPNSEKIAQLSNDEYYLYKTKSGVEGSRVFKYLNDDSTKLKRSFINFVPVPGMKTDAVGSQGVEYLSFSEQEDIVSKYAMLAENYIILTTLADKTTYGGISFDDSFKAFGIDWTDKWVGEENVGSAQAARNFLGNNYSVGEQIINGRKEIFLNFNDSVIKQFIEYATCEYKSAKYQLERYNRLNNADKTDQMVKNYYGSSQKVEINGKDVEVKVIQGARLSTFTGIFKDGEWVSFNKLKRTEGDQEVYCDEAWCLQQAEDYFFNQPPEKKMQMMRQILSHQVQKTLDYLQDLDMVGYSEDFGYVNKKLDAYKIKRMQFLLDGGTNMGVYPNAGIEHSNALVAYIADMVSKEQMSHQECFRMFSGNLACYEWRYDKASGKLVDVTTDFFKRVGGMVSTGAHTLPDVPGIPKKVRCAEMFNEKIESPFAEKFKDAAIEQEMRKSIIRIMIDSGNIKISDLTKDDVSKKLDEIRESVNAINKDELEKELHNRLVQQYKDENSKNSTKDDSQLEQDAELYANQIIKSIKNKILGKKGQYPALLDVDVNDGATYISDVCCEYLLKSVGRWNDEIADAFKLLRGMPITRDSGNGKEEITYTNDQLVDIAKAYNLIYTSVIGTYKYTAFGQRMEDSKTAVTYFDKTAFFPIFDCMATGHLRAVLHKMHEQDVHILKVSSAIKEGSKGGKQLDVNTFDEWDKDPSKFSKFQFNVYEQNFDELRKQFNTEPKEKEYMPLGTQYQKVVLSLITADTILDVNGKKMNAYAIRKRIMDAYKGILVANKQKHDQRYYDNDQLDVQAFVDMLQKQLDDKDASDPVIDSFDIGEYKYRDPETKDVKIATRLKLPVEASSSSKWIESIVASTINKDLVDVTSPGQAFYQRSAWASEGNMSDALKNTILGEDQWQYEINHGAKLEIENEQGSMDVVLSIDFFDYLFREHPALMFQSFNAKKEWLIKNGIISGFVKDPSKFPPEELEEIDGKMWHHARTNIVGYRIPTQAVSSIHAMRCVDVVPVVRDTIIMPKEVTAITGSDYDIDKFFLSTKYYRTTIKDDVDEQIKQSAESLGYSNVEEMWKKLSEAKSKREALLKEGNTEQADELIPFIKKLSKLDELRRTNSYLTDQFDKDDDGKKYWLNDLIDMQIRLLQTTKNNISQLHGSIDSDTLRLKEIATELVKNNPINDLESFDASSLRVNVTAKLSFAIGKRGIGPYALNNNNHVFTMLYGVRFVKQEGGILNILNLERLDKPTDRHGRSILSWLSGLINAHVDVAKDPYIRSLGVNQYTYNLVSLLIRTGYGEETFWFTTQPIMKEIYRAYDSAAGVYNQDETSSQYYRTTEGITDLFLKKVEEITKKTAKTQQQGINIVKEYLEGKYKSVKNMNALIQALMREDKGVNVMKQIAVSSKQQIQEKYDIGIGQLVDYDDIQLLVAVANFKLQEKAADLSHLVQYTKIDTKKQGKTVIEQQAYLQQFRKLLDPKNSPFEKQGIYEMLTDSFIQDKTNVAIGAMNRMLSSQIFAATTGFQQILQTVSSALNSSRTDEAFMTSLYKMISGKIKADYFFRGENCYCTKRGITPTALLTGSNSIYAQLLKIKAGVENAENHAYDSIRNSDGKCNNYLINNLIAHLFLTKDDLSKEDADSVEEYVNAKDDWAGIQFIKSQNIAEDAIKTSDMQNAWLDLLNNSENQELQEFAEKLVVYAFMTSAATGGKFDLFKYVPPKWMTGECDRLQKTLNQEDTFASYIYSALLSLNSSNYPRFSQQEIDEMILNFSYDDNIVKEQSWKKISKLPSIMAADGETPLYIAGIYNISSGVQKSAYQNDEFPGFIKVLTPNNQIVSGQRKYNIYKCVAIGQQKTEDGNTVRYPIYALVKPSGGTYLQGQRVYAMDIQKTANKSANFSDMWQGSVKDILEQLVKLGYDQKQFVDPADMFTELLGLQNSGKDVKNLMQVISNFDNAVQDSSDTQLSVLLSDVESARIAEGKPPYDLYDIRRQKYFYSSGTAIDSVDFEKASTELHVENIDDRYIPLSLDDDYDLGLLRRAFGNDILDKINNVPVHLEFYKKKFIADNGKEYYNVTITVSSSNGKARGWFEVLANIDIKEDKVTFDGGYSVHFKTYSPKMGKDTKYAQVPLTKKLKGLYLQYLLYLLPEGAKLSTHGSVSKGGLNMLNNIGSYSYSNTFQGDIYLAKVGTKTVKLKDGEETIEIPVWGKSKHFKSLYDGKLSIDKKDYDKDIIPPYNMNSVQSQDTFTEDMKNYIREEFARLADMSPTYVPDILILMDIVNSSTNIKNALINTGNDIIDIFFSKKLNNDLMSLRSLVQLEDVAKETDASCNTR